jgi:hypothetical protein
MRTADGPKPDDHVAEPGGDQTLTCPAAVADRPPAGAACDQSRHDDGSTIELRLYVPRRAWRFTLTRNRAARVTFLDIIRDNDDHDPIATPSVQ